VTVREMSWLQLTSDAARRPDVYLTPISLEQYGALTRGEKLLRGYAAGVVRKRWERSAARRDWLDAHEADDCEECAGGPVTADHIVPLVRGGSPDSLDNLRPLCGPCNSRKGLR